ncbi:hypothetical protein ACH6EH_14920 [Paenibacillus sp. JSM ZJ436]|uniref:hypothetical protein n=1 Tax=Paenibacillus sp. JSM ZJ436 TaxID=3376190 RepID=UPI00379BF79F
MTKPPSKKERFYFFITYTVDQLDLPFAASGMTSCLPSDQQVFPACSLIRASGLGGGMQQAMYV